MKTIEDLEDALVLLGVDPRKVIGCRMDDYFHECPYFIRLYDSKWQVFYWGERGNMANLREFFSQEEALLYIYEDIKRIISNPNFGCKKEFGME